MISYDTIGHCKSSYLFKLLGTSFNFVTLASRYLQVNSNFVLSSLLKLNNGMKIFIDISLEVFRMKNL